MKQPKTYWTPETDKSPVSSTRLSQALAAAYNPDPEAWKQFERIVKEESEKSA